MKNPDAHEGIAYLSNCADVISFSYGGRVVRFRGPYSLKRIDRVKQWDHGYLVVMARYAYADEAIEDYIDMTPILERLYMDADRFLEGIRWVEVRYA